ncbi:hypothetical protein IV203_008426 [Nitzschia inconspicua]|uniref:Uncharacterized protein n=1 Tax=Nitzschia inconspicua TaxID=303405 RepID=A0A9K3PM48_9STRA|nr:hypothetical protein IV203_008426 [Nitzschia inconspicua]
MEQCHQKEPIGKAGFLEDINKKIQSNKESSENKGTYESFFGVDWQGRSTLHMAMDCSSFIAAQTGLINSVNDTLIQQLHSKCFSICMEADRSPSRQRALNGMTENYLPYQKGLVTEPSTPADHVMTDHSIKNQNHHKCHVARF